MDSAIEGSKFRGTKLKATQPLGWEALAWGDANLRGDNYQDARDTVRGWGVRTKFNNWGFINGRE